MRSTWPEGRERRKPPIMVSHLLVYIKHHWAPASSGLTDYLGLNSAGSHSPQSSLCLSSPLTLSLGGESLPHKAYLYWKQRYQEKSSVSLKQCCGSKENLFVTPFHLLLHVLSLSVILTLSGSFLAGPFIGTVLFPFFLPHIALHVSLMTLT